MCRQLLYRGLLWTNLNVSAMCLYSSSRLTPCYVTRDALCFLQHFILQHVPVRVLYSYEQKYLSLILASPFSCVVGEEWTNLWEGKLRRRLEDSFKICLEKKWRFDLFGSWWVTNGRKTNVNTVMHLQNVLKTRNFFTEWLLASKKDSDWWN
jgi:hypothetical protein